ncbi:O-antigen ligase family protein [bacterium]|nr:O-antigen ligase family protein [bacterium]
MRILLLSWSALTLVLTVYGGGWAALAILLSIYLLMSGRHKDLFCAVLVGLPFFINSPGRPFVYLLNGLLALIMIDWLRSGPWPDKSGRTSVLIRFGSVWCLLSMLQLIPLILTIVHHVNWHDVPTLVTETFFLDETSHLFPIQAVYNRCWAFLMAFYLLIALKKEDFGRVVSALLTGLALTVGIGLLEYFHVFPVYFSFMKHSHGPLPRLQSFIGNPGWLAEYVCLMLPLLLFTLLNRVVSERKRMALLVLAGWTGVVLFLAYARVGWLCALIVLFLFIVCKLAQTNRSGRKSGPLTVIVIGLCCALVVLLGAFNLISRGHLDTNPQMGTFYARVELWRASLALFKEHAVIGNGPGTFWYKSPEHINPDNYLSLSQHSTAHNTFLHLLAEEGALGLFLFMILVIRTGYHFIRTDPGREYGPPGIVRACLISLWAVLIVYGLFQHLFYIHAIELMIWFILALPDHHLLNRGDRSSPETASRVNKSHLFLSGIVGLFLIMLVLRGNEYTVSYGFHKYENWDSKLEAHFRWTKQKSHVIIPARSGVQRMLCIPFRVTNPDLTNRPVTLTITINRHQVTSSTITCSAPDFLLFHLPEGQHTFSLDLECSRTWRPVDFDLSNDYRELGLATGPMVFINWAHFQTQPLGEMTNISTVPPTLIQPLAKIRLETEQRFMFQEYSGLRFVMTEVNNPTSQRIQLRLTGPNGLIEDTFLEPGLNRVFLKIAPSLQPVTVRFALKEAYQYHDVSLTIRLIEWKNLPWSLLKHFSFQ